MLVCSCGAAPLTAKPVTLATPRAHARTLEERRASACGHEHLTPLEPTWFPPTSKLNAHGLVGNVGVVDGAGHAVLVTSDVLAPVHVGVAFSLEDAREAARRLWKLGRFADVAVEAEQATPMSVTVLFRVIERRTIGEVFTNNTETEALHLATGVPYDPVTIVSSGVAFGDSYVHRGYLDAVLSFASEFSDETHRTLDVCVRFDQGPKITIDSIEVRGSAYVAPLSALLAQEDTQNVHGNVMDGELLERDPLVMAAWLFDHGLLEHKIEKALERKSDVVTIVFQVTDGPVFRYSSLDVRGDLVAPKAEYTKLVTEKKGNIFNRTAAMKIIEDIRSLHTTLGHGDLDVEPNVELDAAKHTAAVVFTVHSRTGAHH